MKLFFLLTSIIYLNCITATNGVCPKKPKQKKAKKEAAVVVDIFPKNLFTHFI